MPIEDTMFEGLEKAELHVRGSYFLEGNYVVEIENTIAKKTRKSGEALIVECRVLKSDNGAIPVGVKKSWVQPTRNVDTALPNILNFLLAALGLDHTVDAEKIKTEIMPNASAIMKEAVTKNSFKGERVLLEVKTVKTKEGRDFSRHSFAALPEESN